MNTKFLLPAAISALFAAALWIGIDGLRTAGDTAAALATAEQNRASLEAALRRAEARMIVVEKDQADAQSALESLRTAKPTAPTPAAPAKPASAPMAANPRELLAKDPTLQALALNSSRARLAQEYGPLFATLQLTPAQIEQFTANAMKSQEQMVDLAAAAQAQGADSKQAVATLQKKVNDELTAAQIALLGEDGFRQMKDYERSAQARLAVEGLVGSATLEGITLTASQAAQLATALAQATSRFATGGRADLATVNWDTADAQARQILTPAQFALFKSSAPISSGASRWNLQLDAAIGRAKEVDAASVPAPGPRTPGR